LLRQKLMVKGPWRHGGEYCAARSENTACCLDSNCATLCHENSIDLAVRLDTHAEGVQQRPECRHKAARASGDYRKTEPVEDSCEQRRHQPAAGVVRREPGMQQPRRIEVVDLVPAEIPPRICPTAGNCRAQPP